VGKHSLISLSSFFIPSREFRVLVAHHCTCESSTPRKSSRRPYWMTPDHRPPPGGAADPSRDGFSRRRRSTALHGRDGGGGAPPPPEPAAWRQQMVFSFDGRWRGSRMVNRCRLERPRCVRRRGTTARVLWRRAAAARTRPAAPPWRTEGAGSEHVDLLASPVLRASGPLGCGPAGFTCQAARTKSFPGLVDRRDPARHSSSSAPLCSAAQLKGGD